jgi:hypothetical protein
MKRSRLARKPFKRKPHRLVRRKKKPDPRVFGPQAALCRTLPCLVCGAYPSDPHHVRSVGAGGRDADTVPLCRGCHTEVHTIGRETFAAKHGVDVRAEAARLAKQLKGGDE